MQAPPATGPEVTVCRLCHLLHGLSGDIPNSKTPEGDVNHVRGHPHDGESDRHRKRCLLFGWQQSGCYRNLAWMRARRWTGFQARLQASEANGFQT